MTDAVKKPNKYTTMPGDSLAGIAHRELGDNSRWAEIRDLNSDAFPYMRSFEYYPVGSSIILPEAA